MDRLKWASPNDSLPTERYLDIISQGCTAHNVSAEWIRFIDNHKCISRKKSTEFTAFTMTTANVPILSWDQVTIVIICTVSIILITVIILIVFVISIILKFFFVIITHYYFMLSKDSRQ